MRNRNWPQYNKQLVQRGSLTFLLDSKTLKLLKSRGKNAKFGRPIEFSEPLILLLFMVKIHYKLPYRMLEGFAKYILSGLYSWLKIPT
jgi:Transposase DDE domain